MAWRIQLGAPIVWLVGRKEKRKKKKQSRLGNRSQEQMNIETSEKISYKWPEIHIFKMQKQLLNIAYNKYPAKYFVWALDSLVIIWSISFSSSL